MAEAVRCLEAAIALFLEIGRLSIAARHYKVARLIYVQMAAAEDILWPVVQCEQIKMQSAI